jgi:hypothetical protein
LIHRKNEGNFHQVSRVKNLKERLVRVAKDKEAVMSAAVSRKSRRNFLLAVTAGGAATAAAVVAQKSPTAAAAADKSKRAGAGYAESAHIRNYYRTAKV